MLKVEKYTRKTFDVDAVLVTEKNLVEVAAWCSGKIETDKDGKYIKVEVNRPVNDRQTKAYVGDRVLKAGKQFKVYEEKPFRATFELVRG